MNPVESLVKLAVLDLDDVRLTLLVPRLSKLHQQTRQSIPAGAIAVADEATERSQESIRRNLSADVAGADPQESGVELVMIT